ncbi:hypothetical protein N7495_000944 [Penicillium taxi]|uniref:uncharacterized protein n=1 Tax=Penicillium taxi TaxID=168475 RepID=UPI0025452493|nr:uncharacterized protein N7495_000944 [Penicillium taxi]KAJ5908262.1 hypothetical protein N7495_000944 [Penicillium taxi]
MSSRGAPLSSIRSTQPRSTDPNSFQTTASVIKFRCLFTHDLRRKSKRWQDGYLQYHTFNKRIMVYDENSNFVGDQHRQTVSELQEGDELELEMCLVEVGETMSTTHSDISNFFEKKGHTQGSPQPQGQHTPRPSISSQPVRSLKDLLSIRKTPTAHLASPYEERHRAPPSQPSQLSQSPQPERAFKRQKTVQTSFNTREPLPEVVDLTGSDKEDSVRSKQAVSSPREQFRSQHKPAPAHQLPPPSREKSKKPPANLRPDHSIFANPGLPVPPQSGLPRGRPNTAPVHHIPPSSQEKPKEASAKPGPDPPIFAKPDLPVQAPPGALRGRPNAAARNKLIYTALLPISKSINKPVKEPDPKSNTEYLPSASTQFALEVTATRRPLDTSLRKATSGPSALTRPSIQTEPTLQESTSEGPWTSEALDLFDFWHPDRPKPG